MLEEPQPFKTIEEKKRISKMAFFAAYGDHFEDLKKQFAARGIRYGYDEHLNKEIKPPKGWRIIPEFCDIPQIHREYLVISPYGRANYWTGLWAEPRRCHSTGTPFAAMIYGAARAYAEEDK